MGVAEFTRARDRLLAVEHADLHSVEVCEVIIRALRDVVDFECGAVMTTDPATLLPATGVVEGFPSSACAPFWENEILDPDFNKFAALARSTDPVASLHDAVGGELERSPRYSNLYAALDPADELRMAFAAGSACLAVGAVLRPAGRGPYTTRDLVAVRDLLPVATRALRRAQGCGHEATAPRGPAVVLLDAEANVVSMTEGAQELLDDLRIQVDDGLPGTLRAAATKARWSRAGTTVTTRVRGLSGRWLRAHVAPMAGEVGTVALTIEPAPPGDLAAVLLDSYGLTPRESDIVLWLCQGVSTKEIAAELLVSPHTVRDHIKAIFEKVGVSSRGELVAKLFTNHILDGFHGSVRHVTTTPI